MLNQPDSPEPLLPKPEFPPIPALKKPDEGVALELKYPGPAGIANPSMVVLGRWMLAMVSAGVVKAAKPTGWMVNSGVVISGILTWGRVKPLSPIGRWRTVESLSRAS